MVQDGMSFTTSGFVASAMPEALNKAREQRFLESGSPKDLTLFYAAAQGNRDGSGADNSPRGDAQACHRGHYNMVPELGKLINADKLEAYNCPRAPCPSSTGTSRAQGGPHHPCGP
jgi:propionate CoA-transferase